MNVAAYTGTLHMYACWNLRAHELKNIYVHTRTCLRAHECKLCVQASSNLHMHEHRQRVVLRHFQVFSIETHPKHIPTPSKVSGFHLNPSYSKIQASISLKTNQNGRLKEKLKNGKNRKTHRSGPCTLRKMVLWSISQGRRHIQPYHSFQRVRWNESIEKM